MYENAIFFSLSKNIPSLSKRNKQPLERIHSLFLPSLELADQYDICSWQWILDIQRANYQDN